MKVLALDLSSAMGGVTLCSEGSITVSYEWSNDRRRSAPFFEALGATVRQHGFPEQIAVGLGPGSYTGTRIAITAAIGLQLSCGARLFGLPSICAFSDEPEFIAIGDAKRGSFFFARIRSASIVAGIELISATDLDERIQQGDLPIFSANKLPQFARVRRVHPRGELLCQLSQRMECVVCPPLEPIYLREPHITQPRSVA